MSAATSKGAARGGRALLAVAVLALCAAALVGGASAQSLTLCTTTISAPTASPSNTTAGTPITYTATVTASSGCLNGSPTGSVAFFSNYVVNGQPTSFQIGGAVTLQPSGTAGQSTATLVDNSLPTGSFVITASYTSDNEALFYDSGPSAGTNVVIQSNSLNATTMDFTLSPSTVTVGQNVTFNVHITPVDANGNPTGTVATGSVDFSAGPSGASGQFHFASYQLDSTGSVSFSYNGFVPGDYVVVASYPGDSFDTGISGQLPLTVLPGTSPVATTTTVTPSPSSITSGQVTTLTAQVLETGTQTPPPAGGEVDFFAGPTSSNVTFEGSAQLDANGSAQIGVGNFPAGTYVVRAQYLGDTANDIQGSFGDSTLLVSTTGGGGGGANPTSTSYTGASTAAAGTQVTLTGDLQEGNGAALSGEALTLAMGSQSCVTGPTTGSGTASCQITVQQAAGQYPVTASFAGDSNWAASSGSATFTVTQAGTSLAYTGDTTDPYGSTATLSATLTDGGGNAVSGETVQLTMGSQGCSAVTDGSGDAACTITIAQPPASYPVTATFAGDATYAASTASGTFTVTSVATTTTYTGDTQGAPNAQATLSATLTGSGSAPIANEPVTLTMGTQHCTATTDANGHASCTITISQPAGSYPITASFAGDGGYLASQATGTFTVVSSATTVHLAPVAPVLSGSTVPLTGTLLAGGSPLAGKTLTLSLGSQSCTATTNASGAASCSVTASGPLGPTAVKAAFAGDATYKPASDTGSTFVYANAPGGGSFVVGDKTATGAVTFWGAQWSKVNVLSGGPAPSAFKGFALYPSTPQCSATWSTDPGNSSPPPAGPLPAYMAVVVTSASAQSGSEIYGNTVAIVIVKTNAGYQNDPGHAGTGTVVATLCTGSGGLTKPASKTTYTGASSGTAGSQATLSATVTDAAGNPLSNETVTLTMGSQSCTGKTDSTGKASCTVTISQPAGTYPVTATFAGDSGYAGSSASALFSVTSGGGGGKHTSCGGNFNGTSVGHGGSLWFSSVLKVNGLPKNGATITFTGQTITVGGQTINVPDGKVVFSSTATTATTTFTNGMWVTTVPLNLGGNVFLSGVNWQLPSGLAGGLQNVAWSGTISSDTPGVTVNWQWAAAAYKSFGSSLGSLGVKPVDDNKASGWQNSDHAGTPEGWGQNVTGGGTGGGGSNYTGSYSGTTSVGF